MTSLLVVVLGSCQIPPTEVLRGIQRETLVGYFARDHVASLYENRGNTGQNRGNTGPSERRITSVRPRITPNFPGNPPVGRWDLAHPQYVRSPFTSGNFLVDVSKLRAGEVAVCPYTGKRFLVPEPRSSTEYAAPRSVPPRAVENESRWSSTPRRPSLPKRMDEPERVVDEPVSDAVEPLAMVPNPNANVPYAEAVGGKPGFVRSPFTDETKLVDVAGLAPGTTVRCPYSGKQFLVPEMARMTAPPAPTSPSTVEGGNGAPMLGAPRPKAQPESVPEPTSEPTTEEPSEEPSVEPSEERSEERSEEPSEPDLEPAPAPAPGETKEDAPAPTGDATGKDGGGASPVPYAKRAEGKSGYAVSPYGNYLVDVRGKAAGSVTRCPFTGKLFKVPAE